MSHNIHPHRPVPQKHAGLNIRLRSAQSVLLVFSSAKGNIHIASDLSIFSILSKIESQAPYPVDESAKWADVQGVGTI